MAASRTTQNATTTRRAAWDGEGRGIEVLDRLIGDALVVAMILLGFALCLGAARAEAPPASAGTAYSMVAYGR
jgi:hypothetical protein